MLWLLVSLSILSLTVNALFLWLLWGHLKAMQSIQRALQVWDRPEHLATPAPEAGTTWAPSDHEQAKLERQMLENSEQRAAAPSPRGSKKHTPRSARRPG